MLIFLCRILMFVSFAVGLLSATVIHKGLKWNEVVDERWETPAGRVFNVTSADEINSLQPELEPGDVMVMVSGEWANARLNLSASGIDSEGYKIYLVPDVYGGVRMTQKVQIVYHGSYIEVRGVWIDGVSHDKISPVLFEPWTTKNRLTNSVITNFNRDYHHKKHDWVELWGSFHIVDWCSFEDKKNTGNLIRVKTTSDEHHPPGGQPDSWGHYIGWNYFGPRSLQDEDSGEGIQIGLFQSEFLDTDTMIEFNLFYKYNAEIECISVKASNNTVRFNTFDASECTVTLRHTDRSVVEENYFFCKYRPGCGGIRVGCGVDHIVLNNYIEQVAWKGQDLREMIRGTARGAIVVYTANITEPKRRPVENCLMQRNIMVNCSHCLIIGALGGENGDLYPADNTYKENVITGRNWDDYVMQEVNHIRPTFTDNTFYRGRVDNINEHEPGIAITDPVFEYDPEWEIYRPTNVGFEFAMTYKRLKFDDVGPTWRELDPDKQGGAI